MMYVIQSSGLTASLFEKDRHGRYLHSVHDSITLMRGMRGTVGCGGGGGGGVSSCGCDGGVFWLLWSWSSVVDSPSSAEIGEGGAGCTCLFIFILIFEVVPDPNLVPV